ncbi:MAG: TRAP transporter substrate-binding protein [Defluviicoccus sp.]|nr:TRAP transporter substrate-binding protein [Defluviicoccus sp.]
MPTRFFTALGVSPPRALLGATAAAMLLGLGAAAGAAELKLAHFMSPKHPMDRFIMRPWSEEVAGMSGGSLKIRIYPGGALGKGPVAQYKRAVDGVADIAFGLPGFTSKLFPRVGVVELPGIAPTSSDATNALWNAMGELLPEFRRVKLLALWTNERQVLMTRKKPIRSVADMKDLKFRVPSKTQGEAIKALGAVPVFMPINRVYNALNTGVIDGVLTGPSTIISFKFNEVAKYYTTGWPLGRSPFYLVMNYAAFDKLSDAHKALVERTTGRPMSLRAAQFYMRAGNAGLDRVRKSDRHEVIALDGAALQEGINRLMAARAAQVKALDGRGVPASAILKAMGVAGS